MTVYQIGTMTMLHDMKTYTGKIIKLGGSNRYCDRDCLGYSKEKREEQTEKQGAFTLPLVRIIQ